MNSLTHEQFSLLVKAQRIKLRLARGKTPEALLSRTQLREDISSAGRIDRLKNKLANVITTLGIGVV